MSHIPTYDTFGLTIQNDQFTKILLNVLWDDRTLPKLKYLYAHIR